MRARPVTVIAAATLLLLGLAGCQKPTPSVTVTSGRSSTHTEATTFCREGQSVVKQNCVEHLDRVGIVRVKAGERVSFDVDGELAENGWLLVDTDRQARSGVQDEHYFSYIPDFGAGPIIKLEVRSLSRPADNAVVTGVWRFELIQD